MGGTSRVWVANGTVGIEGIEETIGGTRIGVGVTTDGVGCWTGWMYSQTPTSRRPKRNGMRRCRCLGVGGGGVCLDERLCWLVDEGCERLDSDWRGVCIYGRSLMLMR